MNQNFSQPDSLPVPDPDALAQSTILAARIHAEVDGAKGWLPFSRYMELALYAPGLGYYSSGTRKFGRRGDDGSDFITAPELTPLFGRTLARSLADALEASGTREVMEFGAGTGRLAADVLNELDALGAACDRYTIVELSADLRARQRATLTARAPEHEARVHWADRLPPRFEGVAFGNEVLDAMPVRLFARRGGVWLERGVARGEHGFVWADRPLADGAALPETLLEIEGDHDYLTETHEAAHAFIGTVCRMLSRGALLLLDYGFTAREYYHEQRTEGTLMCHYRHRAHGDPFLYPGLQDITAHVDFTGIAQAGVAAGAEVLGYASQGRFLLNSGLVDLLGELDPSDPMRFLPQANAVQKLLSEAEMGELFKVIAFGRGCGELPAFLAGDRLHAL